MILGGFEQIILATVSLILFSSWAKKLKREGNGEFMLMRIFQIVAGLWLMWLGIQFGFAIMR